MTHPTGSEQVVVQRASMMSAVLLTLLFGFLTWSLGRYLLGDDAEGSVLGWLVAVLMLGVFALIAVMGLGQLVRRWRGGDAGVRLAPDGVRFADGSHVPVGEVGSVTWHPAQRTTWTGPDRPGAPRLLSRSRLEGRLDLVLPGRTLALTPGEPAWADVVALVDGWARQRPDLPRDEETRAFLAGAAAASRPTRSPRRPSRLRLFLLVWIACVVVVLLWWAQPIGPVAVLRSVPAGLLLALAAWWPLSVSLLVGRGLLAGVRGDPWRIFSPSADGRYSWLVSGRFALLRRPESGGGAVGLVLRWLLTLFVWATSWVPLVLLVQLGVTLWRLRQQMEGFPT